MTGFANSGEAVYATSHKAVIVVIKHITSTVRELVGAVQSKDIRSDIRSIKEENVGPLVGPPVTI